MKTRNDITTAVWVGDDPDEIKIAQGALGSGSVSLLRFDPTAAFVVWFRPEHRVAMLTALRDKIDAHLKEIADNG